MTRKEANYKILSILEQKYPEYSNLYPIITTYITNYSDWRFGQIICNRIVPNYREEDSKLMRDWFNISFDPFYEESVETLDRLKNE